MENLGVISLYESSNKERDKKFIENINSTLRVKTDIKKIQRDIEWIDIMRETIPYIDNIFRSPNRFIVNEEEVVKIEQAKKVTVETIKHLSKNTNFIQKLDKKTGDVTPSKLLNVRKEETFDTYENRLIYTLIQNMKIFINRRKEFLMQEAGIKNEENNRDNKELEYKATSRVRDENIDINVQLNSKIDSEKESEEQNAQKILEEISKLERDIMALETSDVYKTIDKLHVSLVREPVKKTNVVLKNVNFQYAMKLWNYLRDNFDDKTIKIDENKDYNDESELKKMIDESFLLQYLTLKTLDDDKIESQDTRQEIQEVILEQMVDKMLEMNVELTEGQITKMLAGRYEVIKYKKLKILQEIQKIFRKHIDKYINEVEEKNK